MNIAEGQYWDQSWSPVRGCSHASPGCENCWAERMAGRFCGGEDSLGQCGNAPFRDFAVLTTSGPQWTGRVELIESELTKPLHWRKPRIVALNWMGDLFHEKVPDEDIDRVFAVMALCPQHKFLVLTKRAGRMMRHFTCWPERQERVDDAICGMWEKGRCADWPLPNVALGVSVEDLAHKSRIDDLRQTPASMRFLSIEPLLEDLGTLDLTGISWVIVGGESGPGARPMHPDWSLSLRDQCRSAGVPFFFKQWGEWRKEAPEDIVLNHQRTVLPCGPQCSAVKMIRVGKKAAGRLLDGRMWDETPGWMQ